MPPKAEQRKPSGGRPLPRRLFSIDSLKSTPSQPGSSGSTPGTDVGAYDSGSNGYVSLRKGSQAATAMPDQDPFADGSRARAGSSQWSDRQTSSGSPGTLSDFEFLPKDAVRTLSSDNESKTSTSMFRLNRPTPLFAQSRNNSDANVSRSSSRARWEHVRQHVVPSSASPTPTGSEFNLPPPIASPPANRPSTPKQSRFAARLGFRQVVEHARSNPSTLTAPSAIAPINESAKFAAELRNACRIARYGAPQAVSLAPSKQKVEREITQAGMSTTLLPFMASGFASGDLMPSVGSSTATLAATNNSKSSSSRNVSSQPAPAPSPEPTSVMLLHQVLMQYASFYDDEADAIPQLPLEDEVLSALLLPFFPTRNPKVDNVESEQRLAVEAFEMTVKTWPSSSTEAEIERVLWICRAAPLCTPSSYLRSHLIGVLYSVIFPRGGPLKVNKPIMLQTLLQALFQLRAAFSMGASGRPNDDTETHLLSDLIAQVQRGELGILDTKEIEEMYGVPRSKLDEDGAIFAGVARCALLRCIEWVEEERRRWLLDKAVDEYWPLTAVQSHSPLTSLMVRISTRNIASCLRSCNLTLLSLDTSRHPHGEASMQPSHARLIHVCLRIVQTRALPDLFAVPEDEEGAVDVMALAVRALFEVLSLGKALEATQGHHSTQGRALAQRAAQLIGDLYRAEDKGKMWKVAFEKAWDTLMLEDDTEWARSLAAMDSISSTLHEEVKKGMVTLLLPVMNKRLIASPPRDPKGITRFLTEISQQYPQIFYKPIFACAAASKETHLVQQLRTLTMLASFVPDFWTRDAEMIGVAVLSDLGAGKTRPPIEAEKSGPSRPKPRLGQTVLLVEMVCRMRAARLSVGKEGHRFSSTEAAQSSRALIQFAVNLETRLGVLLSAKEKTAPVPLSQRALYCALFLEIRLLTRSLKPSSWLSRVVDWVMNALDDNADEDFDYYGGLELGKEDEVEDSLSQAKTIYTQRQDLLIFPQHQSSMPQKTAKPKPSPIAGTEVLDELRQGLVPSALKLLVAVFALLSANDHQRLGRVLWEKCLNGEDRAIFPSVCFLLMQFAEKTSESFADLVKSDIESPNKSVRLQVIRRFSILASWRYQVLAQPFIVDRSHPRPFKLTRPQASFIPTDMGSSRFVRGEDADDYKDSDGSTLPLELRKRLSEIGWEHDEGRIDQRSEWTKTPISLLPVAHLDRLDPNTSGYRSPSPTSTSAPGLESSPQKGFQSSSGNSQLLRRNSSGASRGGRHRAVFVPALAQTALLLAPLLKDADSMVAEETRQLTISLMKEDSSILGRPLYDMLPDGEDGQMQAITSLRVYLHAFHRLPPPMAHSVFNHLAGYLKSLRQSQDPSSLRAYAYVVSILSKSAMQVSEMSLRELRRAKFDIYLVPSGSLWFPPSAPDSYLFPKGLSSNTGATPDELPASLVWITTIRVSQNMLFLSLLKRNPQEVQVIRKSISRLVLPTREGALFARDLELMDFVPRKRASSFLPKQAEVTLDSLSLTLSQSYVLLITQILRLLSRHMNDRKELTLYFEGLNRILLAHGTDGGMVTRVMIAFLIAATRLHRLFTSGGGYTLFMPAVVKTYAESLTYADLRRPPTADAVSAYGNAVRDAIEYAVTKFYTIHKEAFVFQTLDVISRMMKYRAFSNEWVAQRVCRLFLALGRGQPILDSAGIRGSTKDEEKEALTVLQAEANPQMLFTFLRRDSSGSTSSRTASNAAAESARRLEEEYVPIGMPMDNLVRLFLTVIAHDPAVLRAQHFLQLLAFFTPYLTTTYAVIVLGEGIDALGVILLTRAAVKSKTSDGTQLGSSDGISFEAYSQDTPGDADNQARAKAPVASDLAVMRFDYLTLVSAYTDGGGKMPPRAVQRVVDLVRQMANSATRGSNVRLSDFLRSFTRATLRLEPLPEIKAVTHFISTLVPIVEQNGHNLDCTGIFEALSHLCTSSVMASDATLAKLVVTQFCSAGLRVCSAAAEKGQLETLSCRESVIALVCQAISLPSTDVIAELERCAPTPGFLAGFVMPLLLRLKTSEQVVAETRWADGARHARAWGRLLAYSLASAEGALADGTELSRAGSLSGVRRSASQDRRTRPGMIEPALRVAAALQLVKVIVLRGEHDLAVVLPGVWLQIGAFVRAIVADGDGIFATHSNAPTPLPLSPLLGAATSSPVSTPTTARTEFNVVPPTPTTRRAAVPHAAHPRIVDYLLWTTLELLCLQRSPLMLQLRAVMLEKTALLARALSSQQRSLGATSPTSALFPSTPISHISSSSPFSKPRRRSAYVSSSPTPSPNGSPRLGPSPSLALGTVSGRMTPPHLSLSVPDADEEGRDTRGRQAGYALRSAVSPGGATIPRVRRLGRKIVHLGPVDARTPTSPTTLKAESDGASGGAGAGQDKRSRVMAALTGARITATELAQRTYDAMRLVQAFSGHTQAPLPRWLADDVDGGGDSMQGAPRADMLTRIAADTRALVDEFDAGDAAVELEAGGRTPVTEEGHGDPLA